MPRFAANLSTMFGEVAMPDRFGASAKAGFGAVEIQFPYEFAAADIAERLKRAGQEMALFNLPGGDRPKGERGSACLPGREAEFEAGVAEAIAYAKALGCARVNCLAGIVPQGADPAAARRALVGNLRFAARAFRDEGVALLVEPINSRDLPGFAVTRSAEAIELLGEVGEANLALLYDVYHMQRMEGELAATIERLLPRIGHVHVADNPGRGEPGTGEIAFDFLVRRLDALGYAGWVGCEYVPLGNTEDGLSWLAAARGR